MKKFCKLLTLILALALLVFTPGLPVAVNTLAQLVVADNTSDIFTAPNQDSDHFVAETISTDALSSWTQPSGNFLISQQVTVSTNADFHEKYPYTTLSNADAGVYSDRSPYVITSGDNYNMPDRGGYTSNAITLSANGCYVISVDYRLKEQYDPRQDSADENERDKALTNTTRTSAFGTFYLNDKAIPLLNNRGWNTVSFYVRTDKLESASVTPELYFGSTDTDALGAIYFDRFNITAINESQFNDDIENLDLSKYCYMDFTNDDAYVEVTKTKTANTNFTASTDSTSAASTNSIATANVPHNLGLDRNYFHAKDGKDGNVMLLKANASNASLTLESYQFTPRPHEVYMFQFYSIATADDLLYSGFYFIMENTNEDLEIDGIAQEITNLSSYPYHNGWQLNTVFFVAGPELGQEYELSFALTNGDSTTGWVCLDELKIYKVNGSYAAANASATGVHNTINQYDKIEASEIANGFFELGTAADNVNEKGTSYPYPLVASSWTTNVTTNGIVNLNVWDDRFGEYPGSLNNETYFTNNHVYMMHNASRTLNTVTSPILTTDIGATTYVSFDAYGKGTSVTRAYIFTAETDSDGATSQEIILGNALNINANGWQHYEFELVDSAYATAHNYYLRFEMTGVGYAYFDNVRLSTEGPFQHSTAGQTEWTTVDLNNAWTNGKLWASTDDTEFVYFDGNNEIKFETKGKQKVVIQHSFAYNLTANEYYEIVFTAHGENAYLGFSSYDGLLAVTRNEMDPDADDTYKIYIRPSSDATTVNLQVTLGYVPNDDDDTAEDLYGEIFIRNIEINSITVDDYNTAKANASKDARIKILSLSEATDDNNDTDTTTNSSFWDSFNDNWWYLVPTLITAVALLLAVGTFLFRKIKFDRHITKKTTSYARDMRLKNQQNKIVAQKAVKVDNVTDEPQNN